MKKKVLELEVEFIGSQTHRLTADDEKQLSEYFKQQKAKNKRERGVKDEQTAG
ncbi:MAG: hypothetical protein IPN95_14820 [Bacteroidetes bacterium]|nr:hypothetical protein [Bacteroidota bacterium]